MKNRRRGGARVNISDPEILGRAIDDIDKRLFVLAAVRMNLARQIGKTKVAEKRPILCPQKEQKRLRRGVETARKLGLNSDFGRAFHYLLIAESCRVQIAEQDSVCAKKRKSK